MADLAVVALGLDATGMTSGAAQATRALTSVEKEMSQAEKQSQQFGKALTNLGGPIGQVHTQIGGLVGRFEGLAESFGVVGGAAIALGAGIVTLAAGMAHLTIQGAKIADEMLDISEATGLSIEQVQRLSTAMSRAGESSQSVERNFKTFQAAVVEAQDSSSKAAQNFRTLGIDATKAGDDVGAAFIEALSHLKDYQATSVQAVASTEVFGRGINSLIRSAGDLNDILTKSRQELEDTGIIASQFALDHAAKLDTAMNRLNTDFNTFQTILNGIDGGVITGVFDDLARGLEKVNGWLNKIGPDLKTFFSVPFVSSIIGGAFGNNLGADQTFQAAGPKRSLGFIPPAGGGGGGRRGGGGRGGGSSRADTSPNLPTSFDPIVSRGVQRAFDLINAMNDANAAATKAARELPVVIDTVVDIFNRVGLRTLAGAPAPPLGGPNIGALQFTPLSPDQIQGPRQQRIEDALGGIFEDFVFQITTARSTVGDAFKGLLLGITDTFAAEFAKAVQESLRDAFIKPLANWLEDALKGIFEGIDLKGVSKFFLTLGKSFVGAFAEGGTIAPGHWGIAGEKGAEVVYAGSQPMHIQPMGGGGHITMNFAISTASGEVSQRTQDQIADSAARGIERASRLRGAR